MTEHPEQHVLDAIDQLVNESLAAGPVDDYNADRYPKCSECHCDWHGEQCEHCGCQWICAVEEPAPHREIPPWSVRQHYDEEARARRGAGELGEGWYENGAPWVTYHDDRDSRGYTLADLRAMQNREWRPQSYVQHDYPQRYVLGQQGRPRVRFWSRDEETNRLYMVEGDAEVMQINWNRDGVTVTVNLERVGHLVINDETSLPFTPVPAREMVDDMVAMEAYAPEGFQHVGYLHPEDAQITCNRDYEPVFGQEARVLQERYEARIRVDNAINDGMFERLERLNDRRYS